MRYAITELDYHAEVGFSGERGICPDCHSIVIGHHGEFKIKHWKHYKRQNCDSWYEPITLWHLSWQNLFPEKFREISIVKGEIKHRADIKLNNGLVIEVQNSPIQVDEIKDREAFYGSSNMIWILNGETLANNSYVESTFIKRQFQLNIMIPDYLEKVDNYDFDVFRESILRYKIFQEIKDRSSNYEASNGHYITFDFNEDVNLSELEPRLRNLMEFVFKEIYGYKALKEFQINYSTYIISEGEDKYCNVNLKKKHWRKFIDSFSFPVFIDKMNGLDNDKLFWYQRNAVISKVKFLEKYKKYCL